MKKSKSKSTFYAVPSKETNTAEISIDAAPTKETKTNEISKQEYTEFQALKFLNWEKDQKIKDLLQNAEIRLKNLENISMKKES